MWVGLSEYDDTVSQQFTKCMLICNGKSVSLSFITFCLYWNIKIDTKKSKTSHPRVYFIIAIAPSVLHRSTLLNAIWMCFASQSFAAYFKPTENFQKIKPLVLKSKWFGLVLTCCQVWPGQWESRKRGGVSERGMQSITDVWWKILSFLQFRIV